MHTRAIVTLLVLTTGCATEPPATPTTSAKPAKLFTVPAGTMGADGSFPATVEASSQAELSFRVGGEITALPIKEGQAVKKGQLLAQLDPSSLKAALAAARAAGAKANADFERASGLWANDNISKQDFDAARAARDATRAQLRTAELNLSFTRLTAPFAGVVAQRKLENHQVVSPQQTVLVLQSSGQLDLAIDLPASILAHAEGLRSTSAKVVFDAASGQTFGADFKEIATQADRATNTFRAVLTMAPPAGVRILPGMAATVRVPLPAALLKGGADGVSVPANAVFADETGQQYVWVLDATTSTVSRRAVEAGEMAGAGIRLSTGLTAGETIVAAGVHFLREGQQVRPLATGGE